MSRTTPSHSSSKNDDEITIINDEDKEVAALYCKGFVHLRWSDGRIIHTHLDKRPYENFKEKVQKVIRKCNQRMQWLCKGSRELFGTVLEENIIVAVDISSSMGEHLPLLKRKLRQLALEQIIHKSRFTVMSFGTDVLSWRENLVPASAESIASMIEWVMLLEAGGSTNTLGVLKKAMSLGGVEAIYLLTDGRPDQPFETIIQHLQQWRKVVIHTISFNCADSKSNRFLANLAAKTGGRYHYYSEDLRDPDGPVTHRSEDLQLLEDEVNLAKEQLVKAERLYEECSRLQQLGKVVKRGSNSSFSKNSPPHSQSIKQQERIISLSYWIERNSLLARRLTIIDALGPSSVSHDPTHIDVLDKDVHGKVFEEIFEKAHVGGSGHVQLINPNGIDITGYQEKLDQYTKECQDIIMRYGIDALPPEVEKSFRAEASVGCSSKVTLDFDKHFKLLLNKLKEEKKLGEVEEIERILDEIKMANQYKSQAEALLEDVNKRKRCRLKLMEECDNGLKSPSHSSTLSSGSAVSIKTTDFDKLITNKKDTLKASRKTVRCPIQRGQRVACLHPEDGLYYPGVFVEKSGNNGFCQVRLAGQRKVQVLMKHIVPYGSSSSCPTLCYGDFVLVRVRMPSSSLGETKDLFMPGVVASIPGNPRLSSARYDVTLLGGRIVICSRSALIKIGLSRYRQISDELSTRVNADTGGMNGKNEQRGTSRIQSTLKRLSRNEELSFSHEKQLQQQNKDSFLRKQQQLDDDSTTSDKQMEDEEEGAKETSELSLNDFSDIVTEKEPDQEYSSSSSRPPSGQKQNHGNDRKRSSLSTSNNSSSIDISPETNDKHSSCSEEPSDKFNITIDRGTSPVPLLLDMGTNTGPIMVETGVSTLPEMKDVGTSTVGLVHRGLLFEGDKLNNVEPSNGNDNLVPSNEQEEEEEDKDGDNVERDSTEKTDVDELVNKQNEESTTINQEESGKLSVSMLAGQQPKRTSTPITTTTGQEEKTCLPQIGEQVLARWTDDGWYYRGIVASCENNADDDPEFASWAITDANNTTETFKRTDFITDHDDGGKPIGIGDCVVGLHPSYPHSYAPGHVKAIMNDGLHLVVKLYDNTEATLPRHEVYFISEKKHDDSVQFIRKREEEWVGKVVIARSNKTGLFHPGTIMEHLENSQRYKIRRANNSVTIKNARDIFGELTKRYPLHMGDYVITLPLNDPNSQQGVCYPGQIVGVQENGQAIVQLYNKSSCVSTFEQCFWISESYYADLINRMKH